MLFVYLHIVSLLFAVHDFHVSKTVINYKPDQQALQIIVSIFIDDLESGLANYDSTRMNLLTELEYSKADSLIALYINEHLELETEHARYHLDYIGKEISDDHSSSECYLEAVGVAEFKKLNLRNSILNEIFGDQRNIVEFKINGKSTEFDILDKKKETQLIELD